MDHFDQILSEVGIQMSEQDSVISIILETCGLDISDIPQQELFGYVEQAFAKFKELEARDKKLKEDAINTNVDKITQAFFEKKKADEYEKLKLSEEKAQKEREHELEIRAKMAQERRQELERERNFL